MATDPKKPDVKKSATKKNAKTKKKVVAAAETSGPVARKAAPAPQPSATAAPKAAPVLVNAVRPDEKLASPALVERAVDTLEKSLKAAMPAAAAVNRKVVDIAQANMNSGLELARDLAGAKSPMEAMRLGMSYWNERMELFKTQAEELRALQAAFVARTSEPIREHLRRA